MGDIQKNLTLLKSKLKNQNNPAGSISSIYDKQDKSNPNIACSLILKKPEALPLQKLPAGDANSSSVAEQLTAREDYTAPMMPSQKLSCTESQIRMIQSQLKQNDETIVQEIELSEKG